MNYNENTRRRLKEVFDRIAEECKLVMQLMLESDNVGINEKVGINTLAASRTHDEIQGINVDDFGIINLLVNEYAVLYVDGNGYEWARRPVSVKSSQVPPPFDVIAEWCQRSGIPNDNETVEKIRWSIYWLGIKARPFIDPTFEEIDNMWDEWADNIFQALTEELDIYFNN